MIIAVLYATKAVAKRKPEKNSVAKRKPEKNSGFNVQALIVFIFSGFLFATALVAFITAMIIHFFILSSAVQCMNFHIFTFKLEFNSLAI